MIVIGIILLLAGLLLGGYVVGAGLPDQPGTDVSLSLLGLAVETSAVVVFAMGALTLLLLELGVLALRSGTRRSSRRRAELQRLRRVEAEVQARQSAESQRNASTGAAVPAAPAPFARRETGPIPTRPDPTSSPDDRSTTDRDEHRADLGGSGPRSDGTPSWLPREDERSDRPPATTGDRGPDGSSGSESSDDTDGGSTRSDRA